MKFLQVGMTVFVSVLSFSLSGCDEATNSRNQNKTVTGQKSENDKSGETDPNSFGLSEHGWQLSYDEALKEAKESGKPILIDFTGSDWCGWCVQLHKEVFSKPEFERWAEENVVLLELDFPRNKPQSAALKSQNSRLQQQFNIRGFPTIVFVDGNERELGRYGYDRGGPSVWTARAEAIITGS